MTRVVKEGEVCDQTYRGSASRGLQSPFLPVPPGRGLQSAYLSAPTGRTKSALIITQGFNPGSSRPGGTRAPAAVGRQRRRGL